MPPAVGPDRYRPLCWAPHQRLAALDWQNVHLTGKQQFIEVAARKAKTRQRRIVSISDNLSSWLRPVAQLAGPVVPDRYRERHERLQALAKLTPWPRNVLRTPSAPITWDSIRTGSLPPLKWATPLR